MKQWVYDFETLKNCTVVVFKERYTQNILVFVLHPFLRNDSSKLHSFLGDLIENKDELLGFNNLAFDGQIIEYFLQTHNYNPELVYKFVQDNLIDVDFPPFRPAQFSIHNLDIFKMNHWDNPNKSCSLKWAQFNLDWFNVEEMPIHHSTEIKSFKDLNTIIDYCVNDVKSTESIFNYKNSKGKAVMQENFDMRVELSTTYDNYLYSSSESKIASEIFLHILSEELGIDKKTLKKGRTERKNIKIKDVLFPYIKFTTPEFQSIFEGYKHMNVDMVYLKDKSIKNASKKYQQKINYRNITSVFGLGGAHSCIKSGIYCSDENYIIKSIDVESFYPNLAIKNKLAPAHLPKSRFCEIYENIFFKRKGFAKGTAMNYLFKIVLNCVYGLSMNEHSFLYDPFLTFQITVNGQLLLTMLYEQLSEEIEDSIPLMQNTDGLEIKIPRKHEALFNKICKDWETLTGLKLEYFEYNKLIIGDVNNYIGIFTDGSIKQKGRFQTQDIDIHKNKSALVVPKAIYEYFINGVKPYDYIMKNDDIYDYVIGSRLKKGFFFKEVFVKDGLLEEIDHQKLLRYIVSEKGSKILKCNIESGTRTQLVAGKYLLKICNKIEDAKGVPIDKTFYLSKIMEEIHNLESGNYEKEVKKKIVSNVQLNLF